MLAEQRSLRIFGVVSKAAEPGYWDLLVLWLPAKGQYIIGFVEGGSLRTSLRHFPATLPRDTSLRTSLRVTPVTSRAAIPATARELWEGMGAV